jgi:hypothetical protein
VPVFKVSHWNFPGGISENHKKLFRITSLLTEARFELVIRRIRSSANHSAAIFGGLKSTRVKSDLGTVSGRQWVCSRNLPQQEQTHEMR